jgi:WD40 repeat protein
VALTKLPEGFASTLASSPDGKQFAVAIGNGRVALWDVGQNKEVGRAAVQHGQARDQCQITALAFSGDGKSLAIGIQPNGNSDGEIHLWGVAEKRVLASLRKGKETPKKLTFVSGGRLVVGFQSYAVVCQAESLRVEKVILQSSVEQAFIATAAAPDGKSLAAICEDKKIRHYDLSTGRVTKVWHSSARAHRHAGFPLGYSPDGTMLAFGAQGCVLHLFDARTGKEVRRQIPDGGAGFIGLLAFSPDSKLLALHGYTGPKVIDCSDLKASLKP